jgi:N-acetylglucosaminyldiphosphoundecaprenol N-acetyl-beta-D-mannosaminyltransferase
VGVVLAGKILKRPLVNGRVAGFEFFTGITRMAKERGKGLRYFFLGSSEHVLKRIVERLAAESPHITVCGTYSPPFREKFSAAENKEMIATINVAKPDVVWVGMTAPKQEKWIHLHRRELEVPLIGAIGAVFDFYAGTRKRAPAWVCNLGLEWLPRLVREPRRLFRRNFVSTPIFLAMILREKIAHVLRGSDKLGRPR